MQIEFDTSELATLAALLDGMGARVAGQAPASVEKSARTIAVEAANNARTMFTKASTGATAAGVEVVGGGLQRAVQSTTRGGFYSEFGSPTTGGPRPWLSAAGERGAESLGDELQDLVDW